MQLDREELLVKTTILFSMLHQCCMSKWIQIISFSHTPIPGDTRLSSSLPSSSDHWLCLFEKNIFLLMEGFENVTCQNGHWCLKQRDPKGFLSRRTAGAETNNTWKARVDRGQGRPRFKCQAKGQDPSFLRDIFMTREVLQPRKF